MSSSASLRNADFRRDRDEVRLIAVRNRETWNGVAVHRIAALSDL